ncbi:MAG: ABC transporter permease [Candidatus Brocadia sp. AMX2]|uniref:ABC transporter permease n=1 Tax=Candidatus Brocadia sinica JPN1 TaxID=1197129 RepID=A0ABQ0JWS9_9BACT|nr:MULTISPECIES: ABC transporter permease [Brocadia]KXK29780.1 MAG: hypothetical protein UZ01_02157 [Candidatus Brocadia sinica]MBC6931874.1 ABC transporter permease [Candidatus Brocadia sp.]MBL1167271.1 ABC transporter permease [Candidatus Brocadia sp. AMX1]NOG41256.1 ABC transporter permease [Planctomycetota bacterium]KAA0245681.1 MAG: ABC transporter permease [Candidatus Brocadia sp. AMX2]
MNRCVFAIAGNTGREIVRQTIFYLIGCGGILFILLSFSFTLFAFGEETRMIKEMGISTITICCLCLASLSAANTISKEIEKGTIMTLLSKPVDKGSVLFGKFLGILLAVSSVFVLMSLILTVSLCVKESLDCQAGVLTAFKRVGYLTVFQLIFAFLQVAIMCAIATAGSVYLPVIANLSCCMVIYVLGNVINSFQDMLYMNGDGTRWCLAFFGVFFPNLEEFSAVGVENKLGSLSIHHLVLLMIYAVLYTLFVLVLTFVLFNRKECR